MGVAWSSEKLKQPEIGNIKHMPNRPIEAICDWKRIYVESKNSNLLNEAFVKGSDVTNR